MTGSPLESIVGSFLDNIIESPLEDVVGSYPTWKGELDFKVVSMETRLVMDRYIRLSEHGWMVCLGNNS